MDLADKLIGLGVLQDKLVTNAFRAVDRRDFLPDSQKHLYLENRPLPIGFEQTNSQPFTVAFMLELLLAEPGDKILDVGSGSGWTAALISQIVGGSGKVIGVEKIPELVDLANRNLQKNGSTNTVVVKAGQKLGLPNSAPFDKIIVSAAAKSLPEELIDQLEIGGRLVIPIKESIWVFEKRKDETKQYEFPGFVFVPLVS